MGCTVGWSGNNGVDPGKERPTKRSTFTSLTLSKVKVNRYKRTSSYHKMQPGYSSGPWSLLFSWTSNEHIRTKPFSGWLPAAFYLALPLQCWYWQHPISLFLFFSSFFFFLLLMFLVIKLLWMIQELLKKKVTKPYSPVTDGHAVEMIHKESPQQVPTGVSMRSTFGNSSN